jgi:sortase A
MDEPSKTGYMKKMTALIVILLTIGAGLLVYPTAADLWNRHMAARTLGRQEAAVQALDPAQLSQAWQAALDYNQKHTVNTVYDAFSDQAPGPDDSLYESLLNVGGDGVMGSISIPSIGVDLPIGHGLSDKVLRHGVGHMPGTSLPVGGSDSHCVLSGHCGLPSARLFTDLDQLEEGDLFLLRVLDQTLAYQVDQIKVVLPDQVQDLAIQPGQDLCTLVTCTPYGVNTHRLLVRGHRVPLPPEEVQPSAPPPIRRRALAAPALLALAALLLAALIRLRRKAGR